MSDTAEPPPDTTWTQTAHVREGGQQSNLSKLGAKARVALVAVAALIVGAVGGAVVAPAHKTERVAASSKALLGMSSPSNLWATRVKEVGPGLQARRIFVVGFTGSLSLATTACSQSMTPVISFKTSPWTWAQVADGKADSQLVALHTKLVNLPCAVFVAIHHEPNSDGTAADFTRMQLHALPIVGGTLLDAEVRVGVILNGFFFNTGGNGLSDAQLDTWAGPGVRAVSDFIAADTYQLKAGAEDVGSKVRRMSAWAVRVNAKTPTTPVRALGLGEFNSQSGPGITDGLAAIAEGPLFGGGFACVWNTDLKTVHVLTGARLTAFKAGLQNW